MTLAPGSTFGPYQILGPLGRGGMASVYKAYEPALDRYVALKVLREFVHDQGFAARFEREAKVIAKLEHPNIIPIHNFGIEPASGTPWMAMRFISGGPLSAVIKGGRLAPSRAITILRGVAEALDYAHGKGVIHRDVKPQNILLDDAERVYLADFGIAKIVENSPGLTVAGMVTGTPQYMAPEQGMGKKIDSRVDIYALGVVAYEMLTGRVPFSADTPVAVLMKHVTGPIPVPAPEEVPEVFTRALLKALAKNPEERWPSAGAFLQALELGLGEAPTAIGIPSVGDTPTFVSDARQVATMASADEAGTTPFSGRPGTEPTLVSDACSPAPPGTSPAPARPSAPEPSVSGRGLMLGLLAAIIVLGLIGAVVLLRPRPLRTAQAPEGTLVAQSSPAYSDSSSRSPSLPPPMAAPTEPGVPPAVAPGTTLPWTVPSQTPVPTPEPTPVAPPPYRDAGKVTKDKDFFEKTLTFVQNGTVAFDAQVGPLRIPSIQFVAKEDDNRRVDLQALFPVECPKDAGAWDFVIQLYWLDENGNTMQDDTDHDSCNGEIRKSTLREGGVPAKEADAIRGVRIRFEATPD